MTFVCLDGFIWITWFIKENFVDEVSQSIPGDPTSASYVFYENLFRFHLWKRGQAVAGFDVIVLFLLIG